MPLWLSALFAVARVYYWFKSLPEETRKKVRDWRDRGLDAPGPRPEEDPPEKGPE